MKNKPGNKSRKPRGDKGGKGKSSSTKSEPKKSKRLEDNLYNTGSARNASEYEYTTKLLCSAIITKLPNGHDIAQALEQGKEFDFAPHAPTLQVSKETDPDKKKVEDNQFQQYFGLRLKLHIAREDNYRANKLVVQDMLMEQCTDRMKSKLQAREDYQKIKYDRSISLGTVFTKCT